MSIFDFRFADKPPKVQYDQIVITWMDDEPVIQINLVDREKLSSMIAELMSSKLDEGILDTVMETDLKTGELVLEKLLKDISEKDKEDVSNEVVVRPSEYQP